MALSAIAPTRAGQFSSAVQLVEVYATVTDARGEPVPDLPREAFVVEEDGVPQAVQAFSAGDMPLSLAVAVDRSFSVPAERLAFVTTAVQRLLGELRSDDQVMLIAIGSEVEVLRPLSNDRRAAYDAVAGLRPWGTTPLFDATTQAIDAIQQARGRRALILITDGADRYSAAKAAEVVAYAREREVLVYPVSLQRSLPPVFVELASVTGGRSHASPDPRGIAPTLSRIATELRRQYLLGYTPAPDAGGPRWRRITVRVNRPELRVRARDGYRGR